MTNLKRAAAALIAASALVLTACSSGNEDASPATTESTETATAMTDAQFNAQAPAVIWDQLGESGQIQACRAIETQGAEWFAEQAGGGRIDGDAVATYFVGACADVDIS